MLDQGVVKYRHTSARTIVDKVVIWVLPGMVVRDEIVGDGDVAPSDMPLHAAIPAPLLEGIIADGVADNLGWHSLSAFDRDASMIPA
jgi:hypothetical protein